MWHLLFHMMISKQFFPFRFPLSSQGTVCCAVSFSVDIYSSLAHGYFVHVERMQRWFHWNSKSPIEISWIELTFASMKYGCECLSLIDSKRDNKTKRCRHCLFRFLFHFYWKRIFNFRGMNYDYERERQFIPTKLPAPRFSNETKFKINVFLFILLKPLTRTFIHPLTHLFNIVSLCVYENFISNRRKYYISFSLPLACPVLERLRHPVVAVVARANLAISPGFDMNTWAECSGNTKQRL